MLKNEKVQNLALNNRYDFLRHPKPDFDELLMQYAGFFRLVRSDFQMTRQPVKKRSLLVGLRWTEHDLCLAKHFDAKDEQFSVVQPSEADFAAMHPSASFLCGRCGREGHLVTTCHATKTATGKPISISVED